MDGFTSPDVSVASTDAVSAPSDAGASAALPDASTGAGGVSGQTATSPASTTLDAQPQGESSAPSLEDVQFPDDAALQAMPANERQSNWQQLRQAYATAKTDAGEYAKHKDVIEQINSLGGFERIQQQAELGGLLFSQIQSEDGSVDFTAEPFIEHLAGESPHTLGEIVWKGIHQANPYNPEETIGHAFVRDYLGLNPDLLDTYRQIQNPQDAQKFLAQAGYGNAGAATAEELAAIPSQFHDAFKSLSPRQREELSLIPDEDTKLSFLQDKADALQARQFIEQQKAEKETQRQEAQRQFEQRIEARGNELAQSAQTALLESARAKLKAEASLHADETANGALHEEAISWAHKKVLDDPASYQDSTRAEQYYSLSARAELSGDKIKAAEYKLAADNLAKKLEGRFRNALTERTAFWSTALGSARSAQQQQVQNARPRPEIGANGSNSQPQQRTQTVGNGPIGGFGASPAQLEQYKQMLRAAQMRQ